MDNDVGVIRDCNEGRGEARIGGLWTLDRSMSVYGRKRIFENRQSIPGSCTFNPRCMHACTSGPCTSRWPSTCERLRREALLGRTGE